MNLFVAPVDDPARGRPVTWVTAAGMGGYTGEHHWTADGADLLYTLDDAGDERWHVFRVTVATGEVVDLTPIPDVRASVQAVGRRHPGDALVLMNDRDPAAHDLYRVDVRTGRRRLVLRNPGTIDGGAVYGFAADEDLNVRFALTVTDDGGVAVHAPDGHGWRQVDVVPPEDVGAFAVEGFDEAGQTYYLRDSRGRDTAALYAVDARTGRRTLLAEDARADVDGVLRHPSTGRAQAASFSYLAREWRVIDPGIRADLEYLAAAAGGAMSVTSRSADDRVWTVAYDAPDRPVAHYLYRREARRAEFLFAGNAALARHELARPRPVVIRSRDGLDLVCYCLLPRADDPGDPDARPARPLPTVLVVHGGPALRDGPGFDRVHQWLADRGYAVLAVNFRGSAGFGKAFATASYGEWGGRMHDDLVDAVAWAVRAGVADPARVAIMGGSYGGYAALVGLTLTPDAFACAVASCGISSLTTFLDAMPPHLAPKRAIYRAVFGDHATAAGRARLDGRSPLTFADRVVRPLLIGHGARDPRCPAAEAAQLVVALAARGRPVTYALYPDEGHGPVRPANRRNFNALAEAFLARHLGGACEAIGAADFAGSSVRIEAGAGEIPGLSGSACGPARAE